MSDLIGDARKWLARSGDMSGRLPVIGTHSEQCHLWHTGCLVSRLMAEVERLRSSADDTLSLEHGGHQRSEEIDHAAVCRTYADELLGEPAVSKCLHAGADEITRLRSEVDRLRLENEQLKKDLKSLWAN